MFLFKDVVPKAALSLEHYKIKLGAEKTLMLSRTFHGFSLPIVKAPQILLTSNPEVEITEWFSAIQKNVRFVSFGLL